MSHPPQPRSLCRASFVAWVVALLALGPDARAEGADTYELDATTRTVPARGAVSCPKLDLVTYRGKILRYKTPLLVHPAFVERLERFEGVVRDVAVEIYGRAPSRVRHLGTYSCRRIGGYPELLSEHALGNAIDIEAFDFDALPAAERSKSALPPPLRGSFRASVLQHADGTGPIASVHRRFLRKLAARLMARKDVFRVLLGPSYPGHKNHFHFDVAPYRLVDVFADTAPSAPSP